MEPPQALAFIAHNLGLRFVEFSAIPEVTYWMYGASPNGHFKEYFHDLAERAVGLGLEVPAVSSWVRDNRDVTSRNQHLFNAGVAVMNCLIDIGGIFREAGAKTESMITPPGTIRGYSTTEERAGRYRNMIAAWNRVSRYARGKLDFLEAEQMSWEDDPPQTIEVAREMLASFDEFRSSSQDDPVPIHLRYDIGHGPTPYKGGDIPEYSPVNWFRAFPGRIRGAHLKGFDYMRTSSRPLLRETKEGGPPSDEIIGSMLDAIETIPAASMPKFNLVMEGPHLKERADVLPVQLRQIEESVEVTKEALGRRGYRQMESGLWVKD